MRVDNIIYETQFWVVRLTDNQYNLGRCVIDAKSNVGELGQLSLEEWEDLHKNVIMKLEDALKRIFGAEMFNWSCLMNNAFKPEIKNPAQQDIQHCNFLCSLQSQSQGQKSDHGLFRDCLFCARCG